LILTDTGAGLCGGSVISSHAVLTAAHCSSSSGTGFTVIAGAYNRATIESNQQRWTNLPLSAFNGHPNYGSVLLRNDVAVIRLVVSRANLPFTFNQFVQPVALASVESETHEGVIATVSGLMFFFFFLIQN
jgi:secreted trypsin-like serine protease